MTARTSTRGALIEGALQCLRERGYARTTARDIAAASGANLGLIGYYFGSKEALLNAALIEAFTRWTNRMARMTATPGGDLSSSLRAAAKEMDRAFAGDRPLLVAFVEALAQAERSDDLRRQLAEGYEGLRASTAAALVSRGLSGDDRAIASLLMALVDGLMIQHLLDPEGTPSTDALLDAVGGILEWP